MPVRRQGGGNRDLISSDLQYVGELLDVALRATIPYGFRDFLSLSEVSRFEWK